ncbi:MAG TPA: biopolymer transporter ExbD [Gammaproteobacteria bacterium]|nr:biopolymer transporter ExbD [Gammaproteobacteria bacterium]
MKRRWRKQHLAGSGEVNITAFMNLMVILVPFLLITAVFSRITILELDLPAPGTGKQAQANNDAESLQLEVIVRKDAIEVGDRKRGLLKRVPAADDGSDLAAVSDLLKQIKARYPDKQDITLLLESDIPYERMIELMDTLRVVRVEQNGQTIDAELFPAISIGDAPAAPMRQAKRKTP